MPETKTKIIDGESFEITWPYAAGHVLNDAEAKALNQVRSENIGNNLRSAVKEAKEKAEKGDANAMTELRTTVAEYDREYTFALGGTPARKLDPVEREARNIANEYLKAELAKKGRKINQVPEGLTKEQWEEKLEANREKLMANETILKAARKRVAEKQKIVDGDLGELELA